MDTDRRTNRWTQTDATATLQIFHCTYIACDIINHIILYLYVLFQETGTLADRLIQDQVKYAQQEEEVYMLRRDLSVAKQHSQDANQKLDEVTNQLEEFKERVSTMTWAYKHRRCWGEVPVIVSLSIYQ